MKVWIVISRDNDDPGESWVDKVFLFEEQAIDYMTQLGYNRTHYSTGRKRSPSRYLPVNYELYDFDVEMGETSGS